MNPTLSFLKTTVKVVMLLFALSISSCKKSGTDGNTEKVLDANLLRSQGKYTTLLAKREATTSGTFIINKISRSGTALQIHIKDGCSEDHFNVIWDGLFLESNPAQVKLVVENEAEGNCSAGGERIITVDLTKIIGSNAPENYVFHVANGSFRQDASIDPDGVVHIY